VYESFAWLRAERRRIVHVRQDFFGRADGTKCLQDSGVAGLPRAVLPEQNREMVIEFDLLIRD
jgi:hypothetical protein